MFDDLDPDALLDARDDDDFDDDWVHSAETIEAAWEEFPARASYGAAIEAVREATFKRVFSASGGNHDLAATVSDDFEMICKDGLLGLELSFIRGLQEAYDADRLPG
jgi:predicted RNA-binding Zn ribbon-like protein